MFRTKPRHCRANTDTRKAVLCNWGIYDTFRPKFFEHALGAFVSAVIRANFLAYDENARVAFHLLGHRLFKRITNWNFSSGHSGVAQVI